jgi:flagellar export protein FliJ
VIDRAGTIFRAQRRSIPDEYPVVARPYRFGLESVRSVREHDEWSAMKVLADELACAESLAAAARDAELRLVQSRVPPVDGDAATLQARQVYIERLEREHATIRHSVEVQEGRVAAARARLDDAVRERRVLDQLDDKRRAAHALETRRRDGVERDEALALRAAMEPAA